MTKAVLSILLLAAIFLSDPAHAQPNSKVQELLSREEALKEACPDAAHFVAEPLQLSEAEIMRAEKALRMEVDADPLDVTLCYDKSDAFIGYAVITEEIGKYRPITFVVGITSDFSVEKVAVMVYREDRGGEVRSPRFLYQYRGKTADDPIRTNRDIINVSGATLSVRALNRGVKRVLFLVSDHYARDKPPQEL